MSDPIPLFSEWKSFDKLQITTITLVAILNKICKQDPCFYMFPTLRRSKYQTREELLNNKKLPSKFNHKDIPISERHLPESQHKSYEPGTIIAMRYSCMYRGLRKQNKTKSVTSKSSGYFKNSVTIDMAIKEKNISMKLSKSKIQLCGAANINQEYEAVFLLINHIKYADYLLKKMLKNLDLTKRTFEWIFLYLSGDLHTRNSCVYRDCDLRIKKNFNDILISSKNENDFIPDPIPPEVDAEIAQLFFRISWDFIFMSDYYQRLRSIFLNYTDIITNEEFSVEHPEGEVVLGFNDSGNVQNNFLKACEKYYSEKLISDNPNIKDYVFPDFTASKIHEEMINYNFRLVKKVVKDGVETIEDFKINRAVIYYLINNFEYFYAKYEHKKSYMVTVHSYVDNNIFMKKKSSTIIIYKRGTITLSSKPKYLRILYYKFLMFVQKFAPLFEFILGDDFKKSFKLSEEDEKYRQFLLEHRKKELKIFMCGYFEAYKNALLSNSNEENSGDDLTEDECARIQGYYLKIKECNQQLEYCIKEKYEELLDLISKNNQEMKDFEEESCTENQEINFTNSSQLFSNSEPDFYKKNKSENDVIINIEEQKEDEMHKHWFYGVILGTYYFSKNPPNIDEFLNGSKNFSTKSNITYIDNDTLFKSVPIIDDS